MNILFISELGQLVDLQKQWRHISNQYDIVHVDENKHHYYTPTVILVRVAENNVIFFLILLNQTLMNQLTLAFDSNSILVCVGKYHHVCNNLKVGYSSIWKADNVIRGEKI